MAYINEAAGRAREAGITSGGSIPIYTKAGAPVDGTSGTLAGVAEPGSLLVDTTNKLLYQNTNTKVSPTWTQREGTGGVTLADQAVPKLGKISQTVLKSTFTDGGSTSGTKALTDQIPAGAIFLYSEVIVNVAFSGDTTAVLVIGDGSDVDRYNTGTPSIFTTGAKEMGLPSGAKYHASAQTVTLTVTSATDFTAVNAAGSITVNLYYLQTA
jgi:hypothetical protein